MARNPGVSAAIRAALILGLVFVESLALYTLVIIFVVACRLN
jgi:F-type H+-transporting ATPase subunit c